MKVEKNKNKITITISKEELIDLNIDKNDLSYNSNNYNQLLTLIYKILENNFNISFQKKFFSIELTTDYPYKDYIYLTLKISKNLNSHNISFYEFKNNMSYPTINQIKKDYTIFPLNNLNDLKELYLCLNNQILNGILLFDNSTLSYYLILKDLKFIQINKLTEIHPIFKYSFKLSKKQIQYFCKNKNRNILIENKNIFSVLKKFF